MGAAEALGGSQAPLCAFRVSPMVESCPSLASGRNGWKADIRCGCLFLSDVACLDEEAHIEYIAPSALS